MLALAHLARLDAAAVPQDLGWTVLACGVGVLAGFQGIHGRYSQEAFRLAWSPWGIAYLATRAVVPGALFVYVARTGENPAPGWMLALGLGVSSEIVLRLRFFIQQRKLPDGSVEELMRGPFDLLRWYQDLFLDQMGSDLVSIRKASATRAIPKGVSFEELARRIRNNVLNHILETKRERVKAALKSVEDERAAAGGQPGDDHFVQRLAYSLRAIVTARELSDLFK